MLFFCLYQQFFYYKIKTLARSEKFSLGNISYSTIIIGTYQHTGNCRVFIKNIDISKTERVGRVIYIYLRLH